MEVIKFLPAIGTLVVLIILSIIVYRKSKKDYERFTKQNQRKSD
jgi:hypothetical protein